jgi:hypothetical protein
MGIFLITLFSLWIFIEARAWHIRTLNRQRRKFGQPEKPYLSVIWYKDSIRF